MRNAALTAALIALIPAAALSQRLPVETRVDKLEKEMRSVQRRVFVPGSAPAPEAAPISTSNVVSDLNTRIDSLERQLTSLTGQLEESINRVRTLEDEARRSRDAQPAAAVVPAPSPAPVAQPDPEPQPMANAAPVLDPASADPAENAYLTGYRLWEAKRYAESVSTLREVATRHPKHRRASWARNLTGRAYLDDGKPATAAEAFLANYQELPTGDRAADSLYFLGQALMKLNKPEQACKVYDELGDVYGTTMRDFLKQRLPAARRDARCSA